MAIFIGKRRITDEDLTRFIYEQDKILKRIVRTWHQSEKLKYRFENERRFKKAVRRNLQTLDFPDKIDTLFKPRNYLFSTKAKGRQETLYFKNPATEQTGRLRQQHHRSGPLAKIDKKPKKHLFLRKKRFEELKEWDHKQKALPGFRPAEQRAEIGKHHIEFAYNGKEISGWHSSEGTVETDKQDLDLRIASALQNIVGIRNKKSRK